MVCNVFTTSEGAIHMHARQNFYSIKGANHALCALLKILFVLFSPPVAQIAFLVKLCALVVKTVRHFVTNHHTYSSIIDGIIAICCEERRLENTSRETNLVGCGIIISVDSLRRHSPFIAIHGFIDLALHFVVVGKGSSALQIFIERKRLVDVKSIITAPFVGITDFDIETIEFVLRLSLCGSSHPLLFLDAFAKCHLKVLHQLKHTLFRLFGEIAFHIHFADCHAQHTFHSAHCTFPSRTVLF